MRYCHKCGAEQQQGDLFCRACGTRQLESGEAPQSPFAALTPTAEPASSAPVDWVCPICGASNAASADKCSACGGSRPLVNAAPGAFRSTTQNERGGAVKPTALKWILIGVGVIALVLGILALCGVFGGNGGKKFDEFYDGLEGYWVSYNNDEWYVCFDEERGEKILSEGNSFLDSRWSYEVKSVKKDGEGYKLSLKLFEEVADDDDVAYYLYEDYVVVSFYDAGNIEVNYSSSEGSNAEPQYFYYVGDDYDDAKVWAAYDFGFGGGNGFGFGGGNGGGFGGSDEPDADFGFGGGFDPGFGDDFDDGFVIPDELGDYGECMVDSASGIAMYAGPGEDFEYLANLPDYEILSVKFKKDGWLYILRENGECGWIAEQNIIYKEN